MSFGVKTIAGMNVLRLLGKGGMSEVYEVENPKFGLHYAVKLYSYHNDCEEVRNRFVAEGKLLAKLNHPRIVKVLDLGVDSELGKPYFVMELVCSKDGNVKSLADLQPGEADEATIARWYDDMRDGLAYIHGKGVVHRDLKLQNVLIGPDGHVVITDFGISKIFRLNENEEPLINPVQTIVRIQDGKKPVMGSIGYMSPELEMGATATDKSDWYALGVITFKLLTGTWCDSRTNLTEILSSYDPVWMEILPLLLHSNPEGRKCLSFAQVRERLDESRIESFEKKIEDALKLSKIYRSLIIAVTLVASILSIAFWRQRVALSDVREQISIPTFDSVFTIPSEATDEETELMPSRGQFELALYDARALSSGVFADLKRGLISRIKARDMLFDFARRAKNEDYELFSILPEGFVTSGEMEPLAFLLENAAKRLK